MIQFNWKSEEEKEQEKLAEIEREVEKSQFKDRHFQDLTTSEKWKLVEILARERELIK